MTLLSASNVPAPPVSSDLVVMRPGWELRALPDLLQDQLEAMALFHRDHEAAERAAGLTGVSREQRLDAHRRLDVVRRQHEAVLASAKASLDRAGSPLPRLAPRMLLVHRNEWLRRRVAADLVDRGVEVVAQLDNGAEGIGVLVAEQPDVLLVEDALPQVTGLQVLAAARRYAPRTMTAMQVPYADELVTAFDAGAVAAFTRRIPPADIASELSRLVAASSV